MSRSNERKAAAKQLACTLEELIFDCDNGAEFDEDCVEDIARACRQARPQMTGGSAELIDKIFAVFATADRSRDILHIAKNWPMQLLAALANDDTSSSGTDMPLFTSEAKAKMAKTSLSGKDFYFWLFDDGDSEPYFIITPKAYFDRHRALSDRSAVVPHYLLPDAFAESQESTYEFSGDPRYGRLVLLDLGFIEKDMLGFMSSSEASSDGGRSHRGGDRGESSKKVSTSNGDISRKRDSGGSDACKTAIVDWCSENAATLKKRGLMPSEIGVATFEASWKRTSKKKSADGSVVRRFICKELVGRLSATVVEKDGVLSVRVEGE